MSKLPANYQPILPVRETLNAINFIKSHFDQLLEREMNCMRVECPIAVKADTGINDQLDGEKKPVSFTVENDGNPVRGEVVQALSKWKRLALKDYGFREGEGIYTDMHALRPGYFLDMNHSTFVTQWDWEIVIRPDQRNLEFLKSIVRKLYRMVLDTRDQLYKKWPQLKDHDNDFKLPDEITFIHSEDLLSMFPNMSRNEREEAALKKYGAIFLIGIGHQLKDGKPHEDRASDYDDWWTEVEIEKGQMRRGLNGDILVWNDIIKRRFELSSMGIRVNAQVLEKQLEIKGEQDFKKLYFHKRLLSGDLPECIGGGLGQARIYQLLLKKAHIGEVSVALWPSDEERVCKQHHIPLL